MALDLPTDGSPRRRPERRPEQGDRSSVGAGDTQHVYRHLVLMEYSFRGPLLPACGIRAQAYSIWDILQANESNPPGVTSKGALLDPVPSVSLSLEEIMDFACRPDLLC